MRSRTIVPLASVAFPTTPAEFDKFVDSEIARIAGLARKAGITPQ